MGPPLRTGSACFKGVRRWPFVVWPAANGWLTWPDQSTAGTSAATTHGRSSALWVARAAGQLAGSSAHQGGRWASRRCHGRSQNATHAVAPPQARRADDSAVPFAFFAASAAAHGLRASGAGVPLCPEGASAADQVLASGTPQTPACKQTAATSGMAGYSAAEHQRLAPGI